LKFVTNIRNLRLENKKRPHYLKWDLLKVLEIIKENPGKFA